MPPKFIFVRHGEAFHNKAFNQTKDEGVFRDPQYQDAVLTELGLQQAKETAKILRSFQILDIWCSPLTRAIQTAEEIFEETGAADFYLHDNLLEGHGGHFVSNYRKPMSQLKESYPYFHMEFLSEFPVLWVEAESASAIRSRVVMFILYLAHLYKNASESSHIVLVGHANAFETVVRKHLKNAEFVVMSLEEILEPPPQKIEA